MSKYLAKQFTDYAQKYRRMDELQVVKIQYSFQVICGEIEKLFILLVIFALMGKLGEFLLIIGCLTAVRHYMGGIHLKTTFSCLLVTLTFCVGIIFLGEHVLLKEEFRGVIYIGNMVLMYLFAPLPSHNRVPASLTERWEAKSKGLLALDLLAVGGRMLGAIWIQYSIWEQYIVWTLLLVQIESVIAVCFLRLQKKGESKS